ncbi:MAG: hypothetical protein R3297_08725 [Desulfobulbales bacterium]|nr:hypothetical protein [Desulfobulbales bacterium]
MANRYVTMSDAELLREIFKGLSRDMLHPKGFVPQLLKALLKDPTGMLLDIPLYALSRTPKGDQVGYIFTEKEE